MAAGLFAASPAARNQEKTPAAENSADSVKIAMKNVEFHLTDGIIVHIATLNGKLVPVKGDMPVFDDKQSFRIDVNFANITVGTQALTNDLNDYVFAKADAPIKKVSAATNGNELVIKGLLVSKGGIPFETSGTVTATPDGMIRVHTTKVKALKLPVKGLMDMIGLDTQKLIDTKNVPGVSTDKDDLILDPQNLLPPPEMRGHLLNIRVIKDAAVLTFGSMNKGEKIPAVESGCGARNFIQFRGGTIRFGKLTMSDSDLELVDETPGDPFDFAIDHYQDQLVAGYSKMTRKGGLCAHLPDYNKIKPANAASKTSSTKQ